MSLEMKPRRHFDEQFKTDAVKLVVEDRRSLRDVARSLGLDANVLRRWKQAYLTNGQTVRRSDLADEVIRLRRELARVQQERDIVQKALAIFSRPPA